MGVFNNKKVMVLGLLRAGVAIMKYLQKEGAHITAYGTAGEEDIKKIQKDLSLPPTQIFSEAAPLEKILEQDLVVLTPGGFHFNEKALKAAGQKVPVYTDLEIAGKYLKAPVVAITGTNGKSSCAQLLQQATLAAGKRCSLAGGQFATFGDLLLEPKPRDLAILELSSRRLERARAIHPKVSVLLNIYPGHAERYKSLHEYAKVKTKVFKSQDENDYLIYQDNPYIRDVIAVEKPAAQTLIFSKSEKVSPGAWFHEATREINFEGPSGDKTIFTYKNPKLPGTYLVENVMAAICVGKVMGFPDRALQSMIDGFKLLPGRMELVKSIQGVSYYNDAKAVNVEATKHSLSAFGDQSVVLIAGGEYKPGQLYPDLLPLLKTKVRLLIIFGDARRRLHEEWGEGTEALLVPDLKEAVKLAGFKAEKGNVVLFSPACVPEPHVHKSGEHRGECFKEYMEDILEMSKAQRFFQRKV